MEIDSVREIKDKYYSSLRFSIEREVMSSPQYGVRASPAGLVARVAPTISLGVGHDPNGHHLSVRVQHRAFLTGSTVEKLKRLAKGEIAVKYIGRVHALAAPSMLQEHCSPLLLGCSVSYVGGTSGSLGCFVRDAAGVVSILSNNHVIGRENQGNVGDNILQPGPYFGGRDPQSAIATLQKCVRIDSSQNLMDAAIANVMPGVQLDASTIGGGVNLSGKTVMPSAMFVVKVGAVTGLRRGTITASEHSGIVVNYASLGDCLFDNVIEISGDGTGPFGTEGDSGSLVVDDRGDAVGLLFAGSDQGEGVSYANPIDPILGTLGVSIYTSSPASP